MHGSVEVKATYMTLQIKNIEEYHNAYQRSIVEPEVFWAEQANTFEWSQKWNEVLQWNFHTAVTQWFIDGKLNITVNCLDRHLASRGDQTALIWEPNEPGNEIRMYSYRELHDEVCRFANALKSLGCVKGDRVCIYMPMVPELTIAVLSCARIGAVHSVVFAGFSAMSLADRIKDASCKWVICSDFNARGPKNIPVKSVVDEAIAMDCDNVEKVIVYSNTGEGVPWNDERDVWWYEIIHQQSNICAPEIMDSEDLLFILYTSGSTGRPKGVVHT